MAFTMSSAISPPHERSWIILKERKTALISNITKAASPPLFFKKTQSFKAVFGRFSPNNLPLVWQKWVDMFFDHDENGHLLGGNRHTRTTMNSSRSSSPKMCFHAHQRALKDDKRSTFISSHPVYSTYLFAVKCTSMGQSRSNHDIRYFLIWQRLFREVGRGNCVCSFSNIYQWPWDWITGK